MQSNETAPFLIAVSISSYPSLAPFAEKTDIKSPFPVKAKPLLPESEINAIELLLL